MSPLDTDSRPARSDTQSTAPCLECLADAVGRPGALTRLVSERRIRRVLELIESQPTHSVQQLATEVHLSPAHLQRLFKQETGVRVSNVLAERRLQRAAALLSSSELSIKRIAQYVGYGHHSSFVRAFQRRFGQAPRIYREHSDRVRQSPEGLAEKAAAD